MKIKNKSLKSKLIISLILFSVIPLVFLVTVSYLWSNLTMNDIMESFSEKLIIQSVDYIDYVFKEIERDFSIISKNQIVRSVTEDPYGEESVKKFFDDYVRAGSGIDNLYFGTIDGRQLSRLEDEENGNVKEKEWYKRGMEAKTGEFVWIDVHKSPFSGAMVITIAQYVSNLSGEPAGVLAADIDLYQISEAISKIKLGKTGFILIVDRNSNIIEGPEHLIGKKYDDNLIKEINYSGNNIFREANYAEINMKIVGVIPKHEIESASRSILWVFIVIAIFCILMSIIFAARYATQISKPIINLKELMFNGAEGNLNIQFDKKKISNGYIKEIDEMTNAFNSMISTLRELKQSLELKVIQKTMIAEELKEVNEELNVKQEELLVLNNNLENSNKEIINAQTKLVQSEKMASLGMLVAGIAHEINTPLGVIHSNIELYNTIVSRLITFDNIQKDCQTADLVSKLDKVNNVNNIASDRILEIVKSLRNFARLDEAEYKDADIHEGIDSTLLLLNNKLKNKIEVIKNYGAIPRINCYPNQLNQVFMNLFVNAIHAIEDTGKITIKTYLEKDKVFIKIADTGTGIKSENINRIFDPGFTTKGIGVGTGLGLSIVYNIIEKHMGSISVESALGKGTEFTIELPINKETY